jgi:hypothetical protein
MKALANMATPGPPGSVGRNHQSGHSLEVVLPGLFSEAEAKPEDEKDHDPIRKGQKSPGSNAVISKEIRHAHEGKGAE